jgi:hypothetical protein
MNSAAIFQLIEQGLTLLPLLIEAGVSIDQKIEQMITLAQAGSTGVPISDVDLAKIRADFDNDLNTFNQPIV